MDVEKVRKHIGKEICITLKNQFRYTITVPEFEGSGFTTTDKFGNEIDVECDFIAFIENKSGGQNYAK